MNSKYNMITINSSDPWQLLARLADDWLLVVAGDVVEPDAVRVEVVEHRHAELVPLPVVGLRPPRAVQYGYQKLLISIR